MLHSVRHHDKFARPDGFVEVTADLDTTATGEVALSLTWAETIGTNGGRGTEKRFGSVAIYGITFDLFFYISNNCDSLCNRFNFSIKFIYLILKD